ELCHHHNGRDGQDDFRKATHDVVNEGPASVVCRPGVSARRCRYLMCDTTGDTSRWRDRSLSSSRARAMSRQRSFSPFWRPTDGDFEQGQDTGRSPSEEVTRCSSLVRTEDFCCPCTSGAWSR